MTSLLTRWTTPLRPESLLGSIRSAWGPGRPGRVESVVPANREGTAAAIRIRPPRGWPAHRPGQFVTLGLDVDGVRHHRCYSLTSVPAARDGVIEVTVQADPTGTVSPHLVYRTEPGDLLELGLPAGDFVLPPRPPCRLLLVGGGSGLTPLLGMLRTLAARPDDHPDGLEVVLLHHATSAGRLLHAAELEQLAARSPWLRIDVALTRSGDRRLDAAALDERCPDWRDRDAFVCGPGSLLAFTTDHWTTAGCPDRLHVEHFTAPGPARASRASSGALDRTPPAGVATARFARSGVDVAAPAEDSLLEAAERAGLRPPSGCRMGICHTCSTRLESGTVRDRRDGRVVDAGAHVQLCSVTATSDVTLAG